MAVAMAGDQDTSSAQMLSHGSDKQRTQNTACKRAALIMSTLHYNESMQAMLSIQE